MLNSMKDKVSITPGELYLLGVLMQAKYIDYQYVNVIETLGPLDKVKKEATNSLQRKGIIEEDFSGNVELNIDVKKLMEPVFFGEVERTLVAYDVDKEDNSVIVTFHCYEEQISKVEIDGDNYIVTACDMESILKIVPLMFVREGKDSESGKTIEITSEDVARVITYKETNLKGKSVLMTIFEDINGNYVKEDENENFKTATREEMIDFIKQYVTKE